MMISSLVFIPLAGAVLNGVYHYWSLRKNTPASARVSGAIASVAMLFAFGMAVVIALAIGKGGPAENGLLEPLFRWMSLGRVQVDFGFRADHLSAAFALVITGVGSLIHLYSIGYMGHDPAPAKYFAYLNFFCFMMLNLVLGSSAPHVFLGWEGVGLASYLLIGFWHQEPANIQAAQKAFVMNRIGDLGFLLAMFVGFQSTGTLDLAGWDQSSVAPATATLLGLLVFFACTGKSAQIPLFTWLPDAMAGPTPVSALIHAATMVTSGIYLLSRLSHLISASAMASGVIALTGALTALMAAVTACFQRDIKKVLAYSTISQLGFMFAACGVASFESGVFHVMTHAFFKALLFLGAGSVIHALSGSQDIFRMGGLRKQLPWTFWTFAAGWAAILGLPPFSGFFSKDEILWEAYSSPRGSALVFGILLLSAVLTAYYMTRMFVLVFFGKSRLGAKEKSHLHESPVVMTVPLVLLAAAALGGGWFGAPVEFTSDPAGHGGGKWLILAMSVLAALVGAWFAHQRYGKAVPEEPVRDPFQIDRWYGEIFGRGLPRFSGVVARFLEEGVVQGMMKGVSGVVDLSGNMIRMFQTGSAQTYLLMILMAVLAGLYWFLGGEAFHGKF